MQSAPVKAKPGWLPSCHAATKLPAPSVAAAPLTQHAVAAVVPEERSHAGLVPQAQAWPRICQHTVAQALL